MSRPPRATLALASALAIVLAGCVTPASETVAPASVLDLAEGLLTIPLVDGLMTFTQSVVAPAVGTASDLYEPTMEVSDTGTIYVAGHVIGAATTGTPAYFSTDDGATWAPLPFAGPVAAPSPLQGSQPPPGDEGFIVAGADGQAWMADIYLAGFSITGWCDDGASMCYDNRQAYDRVGATAAQCHDMNLNDRPWAAYADGSLLLVNNAGGGAMQIGVMDVPPATPVGIGGGAASLAGPTWNFCASEGGWIPGVPAMRADGHFAVPQLAGEETDVMTVVVGNKADIFAVETKEVFKVTSLGEGTSNGGRTAFDADGVLYVGAKNNTGGEPETGEDLFGNEFERIPVKDGRFILATSLDGGQTFQSATFAATSPVESLYLDGNMFGPGALLTWSQAGETEGKADWYVAHVFPGADGAPVVSNATLAVDEGPRFSAHVMGASVGPDGRAYFLNFADGEAGPQGMVSYVGSTPVSVWIQQDGPALPVTWVAEETTE